LSVFVDKTITCRDCGRTFPFTAREQEFYAEKGFNNQPSRCPECRAAFKARQNGGVATPAPTFDRPERTMYPAVCATCGKATQVPFEPRLGRPVYCRDCFVPRPQTSTPRPERAPSFAAAPAWDRGGDYAPSGSRERGSSYGGGSRERGSAHGSAPSSDRRAVAKRPYNRRSERDVSYDPDWDADGEEMYTRRSSRGRRSEPVDTIN